MSLRLRVVPFTAEHLEEAHAIERAAYPHPWSLKGLRREALENPLRISLVALVDRGEEGVGVGGYLCAWAVADEIKVSNVAVAAGLRRRGIARSLLDRLLRAAGERGCRVISLEVREGNRAARRLYESLGFRQVGRRPRYYRPDGEDALLMDLVLEAGRPA
jgi:ribosomal-protein-alanine N-acetyltransferase